MFAVTIPLAIQYSGYNKTPRSEVKKEVKKDGWIGRKAGKKLNLTDMCIR